MNRPADLKWMAHFFISLLSALAIGCQSEPVVVKDITPMTIVAKEVVEEVPMVVKVVTAAPTAVREPTPLPTDVATVETPGIPNEASWLLESLNGNPPIDGTYVTLRVNGDSYGGFDGCNMFSGKSDDGTPVAMPDGTLSVPDAFRTQVWCGGPDGIMEQADALWDTLMLGKRFHIKSDRLEILDGSGETRLVFARQAPLPGDHIDLVGTAWRLIVEKNEGSSIRAPTLAFLNEHIAAGMTACSGYVAAYSVTEGRLRFPGISMTGPTESCADERFHPEDLTFTGDYSVEESSRGKLLRIRTREGKTLLYEPLAPAVDDIFAGRWSLTTFVEPHETKSGYKIYSRTTDVIAGTEVTIEFRKVDVSGSAGCNTYGAPVSVDGSTVAVGVASVTRAWCDAPERLMEQERRYLDILPHVRYYRIFGNQLSLHTGDDEALLFQAE